MSKIVAAGVAALFVAVSAPSFAQTPSAEMGRVSAADLQALTNLRINLVKAALQLTPEQEKFWPAIEKAIRTRAEHRKTRLENAAQAMAGEGGIAEALRKSNPVELMQRRAANLTQRGADLKNLADAWQPLYQTLKPDQKQRMALLGISVLHAVGNAIERRRWQEEESFEE
jgi:hypothetical protein